MRGFMYMPHIYVYIYIYVCVCMCVCVSLFFTTLGKYFPARLHVTVFVGAHDRPLFFLLTSLLRFDIDDSAIYTWCIQ